MPTPGYRRTCEYRERERPLLAGADVWRASQERRLLPVLHEGSLHSPERLPARMNEWQVSSSRRATLSDRNWVVTAEQGGYFSQLRTLIGWYELESFSVDGLCDACSIVGGPRNALF